MYIFSLLVKFTNFKKIHTRKDIKYGILAFEWRFYGYLSILIWPSLRSLLSTSILLRFFFFTNHLRKSTYITLFSRSEYYFNRWNSGNLLAFLSFEAKIQNSEDCSTFTYLYLSIYLVLFFCFFSFVWFYVNVRGA